MDQRFQNGILFLIFSSGCPIMNSPHLESSEQLDRFSPASLNKIKFHIFQIYINILYAYEYHLNIRICVIYVITYNTNTIKE